MPDRWRRKRGGRVGGNSITARRPPTKSNRRQRTRWPHVDRAATRFGAHDSQFACHQGCRGPYLRIQPSGSRRIRSLGRTFQARIELKSVPVLVAGAEARAKERISVGMIDFEGLAVESGIRRVSGRSSSRMLLIFYGWQPLQPSRAFKTLAAGIWSTRRGDVVGRPRPTGRPSVASSWQVAGSEVSESLTRVLGAATKGTGHGSISSGLVPEAALRRLDLSRSMTGKAPVAPDALRVDDQLQRVRGRDARPTRTLRRSTVRRPRRSDRPCRQGREERRSRRSHPSNPRAGSGQEARTGEFARFGIEVQDCPTVGPRAGRRGDVLPGVPP